MDIAEINSCHCVFVNEELYVAPCHYVFVNKKLKVDRFPFKIFPVYTCFRRGDPVTPLKSPTAVGAPQQTGGTGQSTTPTVVTRLGFRFQNRLGSSQTVRSADSRFTTPRVIPR
jgi:hypothetical protein